jgi:hypothetical protein
MQQYNLKDHSMYGGGGQNGVNGANELEGGATFDDHFYQHNQK